MRIAAHGATAIDREGEGGQDWRMRRIGLWIAVLCALAARGQDFAQTVAFGDSLTANDLLWLAYGTPRDLYGADPAEAVFDRAARRGDMLSSYAVPGSRSQGLVAEAVLYGKRVLNGKQAPATFTHLETGGNDCFEALELLAGASPGDDPGADAVMDGLVRRVSKTLALLRLAAPGARCVVWTVPDITLTPKVMARGLSAGDTARVRAHLERANAALAALADARTLVFDAYTLSRRLLTVPPLVGGQPLRLPPETGGYDCWFADAVHPTAVANAILANAVIDVLNARWDAGIPPYSDAELAALARYNSAAARVSAQARPRRVGRQRAPARATSR
jgi:lysophospholipase L1-like esterase